MITKPRRIRRADITLKGGKKAILSTVELWPGEFETILASPDFDTEYECIRRSTEFDAMKDFKNLYQKYHTIILTGKYLKLAQDLKAACEYALSIPVKSDTGACNFDCLSLNLPRWIGKKVEQAAELAGIHCFSKKYYGSKIFVFDPPCSYQAHGRTVMAQAMRDFFLDLGYDASIDYRID